MPLALDEHGAVLTPVARSPQVVVVLVDALAMIERLAAFVVAVVLVVDHERCVVHTLAGRVLVDSAGNDDDSRCRAAEFGHRVGANEVGFVCIC